MRKRFAVSAVLFLCGGLVLIPCHTAMGQCAVVNILSDGNLGNPEYEELYQWRVHPDGEVVKLWEGYTRFPPTVGVFHDIHQMVFLEANKKYELTAIVRTSPNVHEGFFGFKNAGIPKPIQKQFGPLTAFTTLSIPIAPPQTGNYEVFIGYWARDKEASINVKSMRLLQTYPSGCQDSIPPAPPQAQSHQPQLDNFRS
jgi:hypothetical protein